MNSIKLVIDRRREVFIELSANFEPKLSIGEAELTRDLLTKIIRNAKALQNKINASSSKTGSEVIQNNSKEIIKNVSKEERCGVDK